MKPTFLVACSLFAATAVFAERPNLGSVVRHDPALDKVIAKDATTQNGAQDQ